MSANAPTIPEKDINSQTFDETHATQSLLTHFIASPCCQKEKKNVKRGREKKENIAAYVMNKTFLSREIPLVLNSTSLSEVLLHFLSFPIKIISLSSLIF